MNIKIRNVQNSKRAPYSVLGFTTAFTLTFCSLAWAATNIINTTPKLTTADHDDGLVIFDDDSSIVNTSMVTTRGISADGLRIDGLNALVVNTSSGQVVTEGDHFAVGIRMGRPTATVDNAGSITTFGSNGDGIVLFGGDGDVTNSGSILVQGVGADGFVVEGGDTVLANSGSIRSTGGVRTETPDGNPTFDNATGVYLSGRNNTLFNFEGAVIETTGEDATTVNAFFDGTRVENDGTISASGERSRTISVLGNRLAPVSIINSGNILNSGEGTVGVFSDVAIFHSGTKFELVNTGNIEASGTQGTAIYSRTPLTRPAPNPVPEAIFYNYGTIAALGSDSLTAIWLEGDGQTLNNGAEALIAQASDEGVAILASSNGQQSVRNWGNIIGDVMLGEMDDYFLKGEFGEVDGIVDGGPGVDQLEAFINDVSSTLPGSSYVNFEAFSKTAWASLNLQGRLDLGVAGYAAINQGSMCLLPDSELVTGVLRVVLGGTLCGSGTLTGELVASAGAIIGPGFSPGTLTINGPMSGDDANFEIEISGSETGMFDRIIVNGDADITDGTIVYSFTNGFLPREGAEFDWLNVNGLLTMGSSVALEIEGVAPGFEYSMQSGPDGLVLVALSDAEPVSQEVMVDLKSGGKHNNIDPTSNGMVALVVFSRTASGSDIGFDATKVNDAAVSLGSSMAIQKKTKHRDVNRDGLFDTILYFRISDTGIQCGDTYVGFEGLTFGQSILEGSTYVRTVDCD